MSALPRSCIADCSRPQDVEALLQVGERGLQAAVELHQDIQDVFGDAATARLTVLDLRLELAKARALLERASARHKDTAGGATISEAPVGAHEIRVQHEPSMPHDTLS
jgi:hypothetical protein